MSVTLALVDIEAYMLVFARVAGMILFNPLLSRRNIPAQFRAALVFFTTLILTPTVDKTVLGDLTSFALVWAMSKEILVGMACGIVFQIYYYLLFMAGDIIDTSFGLSMAKAFDPGTNIQVTLSGNLFQFMFVMYFFATDSHLIFIRLIAASYDIAGIGSFTFGANIASFALTLFISAFELAMHLTLPFLAASFVLELSMGVLMKLIPQLSIFSIHFQLKIIVGFGLLFLFAGPVSEFFDGYLEQTMLSMQSMLQAAAA